jgi:DNA polymerase-3 subunit epsilon
MHSSASHASLLAPFRSLDGSYVVLDCETTDIIKDGVYPDIVTLGLIKVYADRTLSDSFEYRVRPTKPMHPLAEEVHGISDDEASTFPSFARQWDNIFRWLNGQTIVIHNADFDWPILLDHLSRYQLAQPNVKGVFCSQKNSTEWANAAGVSGSKRGPSLDSLIKHFGIEDLRAYSGGIHGAADDAWQTAKVVESLRNLAILPISEITKPPDKESKN